MQKNQSKTNFFNLDKPDDWHCHLYSYGAGHSEMKVVIHSPKENHYRDLYFIDVAYFEGPMSWQGANFHVLSDTECLGILRRTTFYDRRTDQSLLESYRLFSVEAVDSQLEKVYIKIIAALSFVSDDTYQIHR